MTPTTNQVTLLETRRNSRFIECTPSLDKFQTKLRCTIEYSTFPPISQFKKTLHAVPQSLMIYIKLWEKKLKESSKDSRILSIRRKDLKKSFLVSPTLFRNHLFALSRLEILFFDETPDYFTIHFFENQ